MTPPLPDLERVYFWAFHAAEIAADEYDGDAFHRAALLAVYRAGQNKWVSVEERLPEPGVQVFVYPPGPLPIRWVKDGGEWFFDAIPVTHWQPLPEPPQSEGEE